MNQTRGLMMSCRQCVRPVAAVLLLAHSLNGCAHWVTQRAPVSHVIASKQRAYVMLTLNDGTKRQVFEPLVQRDSVVGHTRPDSEHRLVFAVPVTEVQSVALRRTNVLPTVAILAAAITTVMVVGFYSAGMGDVVP